MEEKLLARVRALLAKAESTSYPEEAEAFNAKAAKLIAKHGIDQALLAASGQRTDEITTMRVELDDPYTVSKVTLLTFIAQALRCQAIAHGKGRSYRYAVVVGFASDLERVELLYTSLLLQATTQVVRQHPDSTVFGQGESVAAYRRSWFAGFAAAVRYRLEMAERQAATEARSTLPAGTSTALVLRDRSDQVKTAVKDLFPNMRSVNRRISGSGYGNGVTAGQQADLGSPRVDRGQRTALR